MFLWTISAISKHIFVQNMILVFEEMQTPEELSMLKDCGVSKPKHLSRSGGAESAKHRWDLDWERTCTLLSSTWALTQEAECVEFGNQEIQHLIYSRLTILF